MQHLEWPHWVFSTDITDVIVAISQPICMGGAGWATATPHSTACTVVIYCKSLNVLLNTLIEQSSINFDHLAYKNTYGSIVHLLNFGKLTEMLHLANCHTHTLSMHCRDTRLSCLVCFSGVDFANHVKSRLRQWDPWKALDGSYGTDIQPCVSETSLRPSKLV